MTNRARLHIQARLLIRMRIHEIQPHDSPASTARPSDDKTRSYRADRSGCGTPGNPPSAAYWPRLTASEFFEPAMARHARIAGIQKRTDLSPVHPQISSLIDGRGNHRRNIAQLQMLGVTEFLKRGGGAAARIQTPEARNPRKNAIGRSLTHRGSDGEAYCRDRKGAGASSPYTDPPNLLPAIVGYQDAAVRQLHDRHRPPPHLARLGRNHPASQKLPHRRRSASRPGTE